MTYDQYWYGDVHMVRAFYEAHKLRQQDIDSVAWLHGMYVYKALAATVGNIGNKGPKIEYPTEPMYKPEPTNKLDKQMQEEKDAVFAAEWMEKLVQKGKNWGKK